MILDTTKIYAHHDKKKEWYYEKNDKTGNSVFNLCLPVILEEHQAIPI